MAQVYVVQQDLIDEAGGNPVRVVASYPNGMVATIDMHGPNNTLLFLAEPLVLIDRNTFMMKLAANWRDDYKPVVNFEAERRINLAFPDHKQRNYTAQYQSNITTYGADATQWPAAEQTFKAEYDRGWQFISDIRATVNAWTAMPVDPTDDSIWPIQISPIA